MIMHTETPTIIERKPAGFDSLAFLLPCDLPDVYRHRALVAAQMVQGGARPVSQMAQELEFALDRLKNSVERITGGLAIAMSAATIGYSRAETLVKDYGFGEITDDEALVVVPADKITGIGVLAMCTRPNNPEPTLDLRVQTSFEKPLSHYQNVNGIRELVSEPSSGRWHRFPLDMIALAETA